MERSEIDDDKICETLVVPLECDLEDMDGFKCSVCRETFLEPRMLPCGHLMCASRTCLQVYQNLAGVLKCGNCDVQHSELPLNISSLSLWTTAVTDEKRASTMLMDRKKYRQLPECDSHAGFKKTFWCTECREALCEECVVEIHDDHTLKLLKSEINKLIDSAVKRFRLVVDNGLNLDKFMRASEMIASFHSENAAMQRSYLDDHKELKRISKYIMEQGEDLARIEAGYRDEMNEKLLLSLLKLMRTDSYDLRFTNSGYRFRLVVDGVDDLYKRGSLTSQSVTIEDYVVHISTSLDANHVGVVGFHCEKIENDNKTERTIVVLVEVDNLHDVTQVKSSGTFTNRNQQNRNYWRMWTWTWEEWYQKNSQWVRNNKLVFNVRLKFN